MKRVIKKAQSPTSAPTPDTAMKEFREEFINELLRTADIYANLYVQDEADDRECCIFDAQHKDAKALFEAIADAKKALKLAAASAGGRETVKHTQDWRTMCIVEIAAENASVRDYVKHWEGRALKAEAALGDRETTGRE